MEIIQNKFKQMKKGKYINKKYKNLIIVFQNPNKYLITKTQESKYLIILKIINKTQNPVSKRGIIQNPRKKKFDYFEYNVYEVEEKQKGEDMINTNKNTMKNIDTGKIHSKRELKRIKEYI